MLEELLAEADQYGVHITEYSFKTPKLKALYSDGVITFNKSAPFIENEKACTLGEEIGHHVTTFGNILDQGDVRKRKQELRARQWSYNRLIPISKIVQAHNAKVRGRYEIAEYLEVTEGFLQDTIDRYYARYGELITYQNYIIYLNPLQVVEVTS